MNATEENKEYQSGLPRTYCGLSGIDMIVFINGQTFGEIQTVDYDEKTGEGYIDLAIFDRDVTKLFVEPGNNNEVDVYLNGDFAKLKLEINEVTFGGTAMKLGVDNVIFFRRQYFTFATTTFDTYEEQDTPWYKQESELA